MARTGWAIEKKVAGIWTADGTIYRPNDDLGLSRASTQVTVKLNDGSNAYITPSTKYIDAPLSFMWFWDDGTTKAKVEAYIVAQDDIRITDHDSNLYIGRFTGIDVTQVVGQDPDRYNISATFERMPGLA